MARSKNIYRIDSLFITIGTIVTLISVLSIVFSAWFFFQISGEYIPGFPVPSFPSVKLFFTANGIILLTVGIVFRKQEKKIIRIWDALDTTGEARVNELAVSLGLSRDFVLKHLRTINMQPGAYYVWDEKSDKIIDGRLRTEFMMVQDCPGCGHTINAKVSLSESSTPKCSYCGTVVSTPENLNQHRKDILLNRPVVHPPQKEVNWIVFVILVFVFWPAALIYLISRRKSINVSASNLTDALKGKTT
ncbi:MAG: hypothetical protein ACK40M_03445 [Flavobacteriales bacterium]